MSSAQVALNYGAYSLQEAVALSNDERELLLAVATAEQEVQWERFEKAMGISWSVSELVSLGGGEEGPKQTKEGEVIKVPNNVRVPLMMAIGPDFFKHMVEDHYKKYKAYYETSKESGGGPVTEIGTLTPEQAKKMLQLAQQQAPISDPE